MFRWFEFKNFNLFIFFAEFSFCRKMEKQKRDEVFILLKAGIKPAIIQKKTKVGKTTIYDIKKRLESGEGTERRSKTPKRKPVRTPQLIKKVREKIRRNPRRSINKLAADYNVNRRTMQKIIRQDLRYKPLKLQYRHLLSAATKKKRHERSRKLLQWHVAPPDVIVIYSDEKLCQVSKKFNKQNDRVIGKSFESVSPADKFAYKTQKPDSIMIWAAVASNGEKSPIFRIPDGVKINQHVYLDFLKNEVKPWIDSTFGNQPICFTQDSAPAHGANLVQNWCKENFQHFWDKTFWPPSSPDANPMDFAM